MEEKKQKGYYKREYIFMIIIILLIILDQVIKAIVIHHDGNFVIPDIFKITIVENQGGAFGIGSGNLLMFIITNLIVLGIIIRLLITQKENINIKTVFALSFVLAGGISNVIDRVFRGFVLDYIDITDFISFPIFNLADILIIFGWILFALFFAIYSSKELKDIKRVKKVGKEEIKEK